MMLSVIQIAFCSGKVLNVGQSQESNIRLFNNLIQFKFQ